MAGTIGTIAPLTRTHPYISPYASNPVRPAGRKNRLQYARLLRRACRKRRERGAFGAFRCGVFAQPDRRLAEFRELAGDRVPETHYAQPRGPSLPGRPP